MKEAYPDHTQFERNNPHYDSSSKEDNPKWSMVKLLLFFPAHRWTEGRGSGVSRAGHRALLVSEATLPRVEDGRGHPARGASYTQLTQLDVLSVPHAAVL